MYTGQGFIIKIESELMQCLEHIEVSHIRLIFIISLLCVLLLFVTIVSSNEKEDNHQRIEVVL
jgi:hypothetical protein